MQYALRQATTEDFEFCHGLTRQNMSGLYRRHWGSWEAFAFQDGFVPEHVRILVCNERPVGFLSATVQPHAVYIDNIQLVGDLQGKGIGTRLLQDFLRCYAHVPVSLTTFADNPATRLYARLGFVEVARDGGAIIMQKLPE